MLPMPRIVRPDPCGFFRAKFGSPVEPALADPLSETKNSQNIWLSRFTVKPRPEGDICRAIWILALGISCTLQIEVLGIFTRKRPPPSTPCSAYS